MYYGVQYYPEHWPATRWPVDARMMQAAGVNGVRIGEFAWSAIEPEEGQLDFSLFDRAIAILADHGIKTLLCTPSRTPPPWVYRKYPGVRNTTVDGELNNAGFRYLIGLAHPEFVQLSQRIDRAVIEHFAGHPAIIGWQVDNEVGQGNDCYCEGCRARFHDYLREKYGTVERLNAAWGAHFWSFTFSDFAEVPFPDRLQHPSPQLALEYRRFMSKLNVDFTRWRADLIHQLDPGKWVTTNFQSFMVQHTDYHQMAPALDINGMNHYPARSPEFILDYYRGARGKAIVLEQCTRLGPVDIGEGWMRLWAWMAIGHGISGVNFFRWRQCRWGQEQHADGILPHSGEENRRYRELKRMGQEIQAVGELIDRTQPDAAVAVLSSYESRWAIEHVGQKEMRAELDAIRFHTALVQQNVTTDALDPREDLSRYKLVIAPRLFVVDAAIAANLARFVAGGGVLCLTAASGVVDEYNVSFDTPRPGPLKEIAGVEVSDLSPLHAPVPLQAAPILGMFAAEGQGMADEIHPTTAEVLAIFAAGWRRGLPAITINRRGAGTVIYLGTILEGESLAAFVRYLRGLAGVEPLMTTPAGVVAHERVGDGLRLRFLLNKTDAPVTVALPPGWRDAFTGEPCAAAEIPAVDMRLVMTATNAGCRMPDAGCRMTFHV
jgi:beta-galactosidase